MPLLLASLAADTTTWIGGGEDGNFLDPLNWNNGVPGSSDVAQFNTNGTVTTFLPLVDDEPVSISLGSLDFVSPVTSTDYREIDINLNGGSLTVAGPLPSMSTRRNDEGGPLRVLTLRNGTVASSGSWVLQDSVGTGDGINAVNLLSNTSLTHNGNLFAGERKETLINISGGSSLAVTGSTNRVVVASLPGGARGTISVTGTGSIFSSAGDVTLGNRNGLTSESAVLEVKDGGTFVSDSYLQLGRAYASGTPSREGSGRLLVEGEGSTASATELFVGGGRRLNFAALGDGNGLAVFSDSGAGSFGFLRVFYSDHNDIVSRGTLHLDGGSVTVGTELVSGNAVLERGSIFRNGLHSHNQQAGLVVNGDLAISANNTTGSTSFTGSILELTYGPEFSIEVDQTVLLADYSGSLSGTFLWWDTGTEAYIELLEGDLFTDNGFSWEIHYAIDLGSGRSGIGLVAIPEPQVVGLLFGMAVLLFALRSRRRQG